MPENSVSSRSSLTDALPDLPDAAPGWAAAGSAIVEDPTDPVQARGDVALGTQVLGLIVAAPVELIRKILLRHDPVLVVVRVAVPLPVAEPLGAGIVGIAQVRGHPPELP